MGPCLSEGDRLNEIIIFPLCKLLLKTKQKLNLFIQIACYLDTEYWRFVFKQDTEDETNSIFITGISKI